MTAYLSGFSILALFFSLVLVGYAAKVEEGFTLEKTIEALGQPIGRIELRDKTMLLYPEGEVTLKKDRVVEVDMMTAEEFAAEQERLQQEHEEWLQQQERMAAERLKQGRALRANKMKNSSFASLPAKDRVDYWRSFQIRYPEVDASQQIADALQGYEAELAELRSQQRIAELEARVAAAEREASAARLETQKLRDETAQRQRANYGLRYYTDPIVHPRYHYRPPTITIHSQEHTKKHHFKDRNYKHDFHQKQTHDFKEYPDKRTRRVVRSTTVEN